MKIKQIELISDSNNFIIKDFDVDKLFRIMRMSSIKLLLKNSWEGLSKFKILKVLTIASFRKLLGKDGLIPELKFQIEPKLFLFEKEDIKFIKIIFNNNKQILLNVKGLSTRGILWNMYDVLYTNQYLVLKEDIENKIVVDCGANNGMFSFYAAILGARKIYSFEPVSSSSRKILENIKLNKMEDKITLFNKGLGESNYSSNVSSKFPGDGEAHITDSAEGEPVKIVKLDDCDLGEVHFIKMDTEGYEANILKGAKKTIKEYSPILSLSAYHKVEDKIELPKLIKSIRSDYNIELNKFSEEVFYCWVDKNDRI